MTWLRRLPAPLLVAVLLFAPSVSQACSQCLATRTRENQIAFIATTVFLSIMPLLVAGGIALFLRKRVREMKAREEARAAAREERAPEPSPRITRPAPIG